MVVRVQVCTEPQIYVSPPFCTWAAIKNEACGVVKNLAETNERHFGCTSVGTGDCTSVVANAEPLRKGALCVIW